MDLRSVRDGFGQVRDGFETSSGRFEIKKRNFCGCRRRSRAAPTAQLLLLLGPPFRRVTTTPGRGSFLTRRLHIRTALLPCRQQVASGAQQVPLRHYQVSEAVRTPL